MYIDTYIFIHTYIYASPPPKTQNLHVTTYHTLKQPRLSCRKGNCTLCWCVLPYLCGCKVMKPSGPSQRSKASTPSGVVFLYLATPATEFNSIYEFRAPTPVTQHDIHQVWGIQSTHPHHSTEPWIRSG